MLPIRDATTADFAAFRALLRDVGYDERAITERSGAETVADAYERRLLKPPPHEPGSALDVVHQTLFEECTTTEADARRWLGDEHLDLGLRIGVWRLLPGEPTLLAPTVALYPVENLYLASDLTRDPAAPAAPFQLADDAVYPAITTNTRDFLKLMPRTPCGRLLELCGGAGAAGLLMAPHCEVAISSDITERSTQFAAWNARLNGIDNLRSVQSDLYDAFAGERFDRIVAHPPYMPSADRALIYRDGGEDGEHVTRGILRGLDAHLAPGGDFFAACLLTEREDAPVEQRVRAMLGEGEAGFDVVVAHAASADAAEYYFRRTLSWKKDRAEAEATAHRLRAAGVIDIVLCVMLVARKVGDRPAVTVRRKRSGDATADDLIRLLRSEIALATGETARTLLDARPRLPSRAHLRLSHQPHEGGWAAELSVLTVDGPFERTLQTPPEMAMVLDACDGTRTVRELYGALAGSGSLPEGLSEPVFAATVQTLAREGFLDLGAEPAADTA